MNERMRRFNTCRLSPRLSKYFKNALYTASVPMVMVYNSLQWKPSKDGLHVLDTPAVSMLTFTTCMLRVRSGEHFITIYNGKGPQQSIHLRLARPPEDIAHRTTQNCYRQLPWAH